MVKAKRKLRSGSGALAIDSIMPGRICTVFAVAVTCLSQLLWAETSGPYKYKVHAGEITITRYNGEAEDLTVPAKIDGKPVTSIGYHAFRKSFSLESVTIPDSVTSLKAFVFSHCDNLKSVSISENVTSIANDTFYGCKGIKKIKVDENNDTYSSTDGVLFNEGKTKLIQYPVGHTRESYSVPDSVDSIAEGAFFDCDYLRSVHIPSSVNAIGSEAFLICDNLKEIKVTDSNDAYSSVDGVLFNENRTKLIQYPVGHTRNNYVIPESVSLIGTKAFDGCESLRSVTIADNVTAIRDRVFYRCNNLESVSIPRSLNSIGSGAFLGCENLREITVAENNHTYSSTDGVLFNEGKTKLIQYPVGHTRKNYSIPDGVTVIKSGAFKYCDSLESVNIPETVTSIEDLAFNHCEGLKSVTIPDSVTSIQTGAFGACHSLEAVTISGNVTSIEDWAFKTCEKLRYGLFTGDAPEEFGSDVFKYAHEAFKVYYHAGANGFSSPEWNGYLTKKIPQGNYLLVTLNAAGTGVFEPGHVANIRANEAPEGKTFDRWTGDVANIKNVTDPSTTVKVAESDITLLATYKPQS